MESVYISVPVSAQALSQGVSPAGNKHRNDVDREDGGVSGTSTETHQTFGR